ncbi:MAG: hypothetical protein M0003_02825 [Acidithiobacillus sp.]|nr:hypothetical protein [Acidithiobacillus sp.]
MPHDARKIEFPDMGDFHWNRLVGGMRVREEAWVFCAGRSSGQWLHAAEEGSRP